MTNETNDGLVITPQELKFRFQLGKAIPTQIVLYNPTPERYAFKVKTTSPKKYCVRPSSGFVEPHSNRHVEVIMQSQKEYPADLGVCRDKFLLQSVAAPGSESEITVAMFDRALGHDVKENKLKVVLEGPPAPPAPIDEEPQTTEEQSTFTKVPPVKVPQSTDMNGSVGTKFEPSQTRPLTDEPSRVRQMGTSGQDQQLLQSIGQILGKGNFTMLHMILVAVVAFLIGHFTS